MPHTIPDNGSDRSPTALLDQQLRDGQPINRGLELLEASGQAMCAPRRHMGPGPGFPAWMALLALLHCQPLEGRRELGGGQQSADPEL